VLKDNPTVWKELTLYIKTTIVNEKLKTTDELLEEWKRKANEKKKKDVKANG